MLNDPTLAPPANGINYVSWFIVVVIFRTYFSFIHAKLVLFCFCFFQFVGSGRAGLMSSLVEVWRESRGVLEKTVHASLAFLTGFRKLLGGFNQASLSHRHSTASRYLVSNYKGPLWHATGLVWRLAV